MSIGQRAHFDIDALYEALDQQRHARGMSWAHVARAMTWRQLADEIGTWSRTIVVGAVFGVAFKLLRLVPRHERIVARTLGDRVAPVLTRLIGAGEACVGLWMLSARSCPRAPRCRPRSSSP